MEPSKRILWLRRALLAKISVTLVAWAPAFIAPPAMIKFLGAPLPREFLYFRLFGALMVAFIFIYWCAYKDPVKNVAIVKFGVLENGLSALAIVGVGMAEKISSPYVWISCVLTTFFCLAFLSFMPREG